MNWEVRPIFLGPRHPKDNLIFDEDQVVNIKTTVSFSNEYQVICECQDGWPARMCLSVGTRDNSGGQAHISPNRYGGNHPQLTSLVSHHLSLREDAQRRLEELGRLGRLVGPGRLVGL